MPLRVALVGPGMRPIPPDGYGAVEKYIWNVARELPDHGVEPTIVNEALGEHGIRAYQWALRARRELADLDVDLVHVFSTGVGATFAALGPDYVYTSLSRHWLRHETARDRFGRWMDARALAGAEASVVLNERMADAVEARIGTRPAVVPSGVDVEAYRPDPERRTGDRVVGLGTVIPTKRYDLAAEAVEGLDCTLEIAGPLGDEDHAEEVGRHGNAELLGGYDEEQVRDFLAGGDVFVHPSETEGLSLAVLEAMASGLPLVASDICVGQVEDGENGYAIPVDLPRGERVRRIREAVQRLLEDPDLRERFGRRSRELARERYDWSVVAEGLADVYDDLAD